MSGQHADYKDWWSKEREKREEITRHYQDLKVLHKIDMDKYKTNKIELRRKEILLLNITTAKEAMEEKLQQIQAENGKLSRMLKENGVEVGNSTGEPIAYHGNNEEHEKELARCCALITQQEEALKKQQAALSTHEGNIAELESNTRKLKEEIQTQLAKEHSQHAELQVVKEENRRKDQVLQQRDSEIKHLTQLLDECKRNAHRPPGDGPPGAPPPQWNNNPSYQQHHRQHNQHHQHHQHNRQPSHYQPSYNRGNTNMHNRNTNMHNKRPQTEIMGAFNPLIKERPKKVHRFNI